MSARPGALPDEAEALAAEAGVVAVLEPPDDYGEDPGPPLLAHAARLAGALRVACGGITWTTSAPADVELLVAAIADAVRDRGPRAVLFPDSDLGRQLAPMLALDMGTSAVLGCNDVIVRGDDVLYVKPVYGGWLARQVTYTPGHLQVATLLPVASPSGAADAPTPHDLIELDLDARARAEEARPPGVTRLELLAPDPQTVDIVHAERIVGVGAGAVSDGLLDVVEELAGLLQGAVGATRPVVDDGRLPKERLIGQTGKTVAPNLYLALGISGSPHHVAGIQDAGQILAVNRDDHAPIHAFSDTGFAGDLSAVLPALLRRIRRWQDEEGGRRADDA